MSWPTVQLGDAYWFQEGPGIRNWQFTNSGIKLLNVGNIEKVGRINLAKTDRHISLDEAYGKYKHFLCDEGDLVIASSGISIDDDGYLRTRGCFIEKQHLPLCINTSTIRFKSLSNNDLSYLKHWLQSVEFRKQITKLVTGSAQLNFGPSHLKQLRISLPPLTQQQRIAGILDKAAEIKGKREHAVTKLDELARSTFVEMFGDPVSNPKNLKMQKLTEFFRFKTGKLDSNAAVENGKYPFFTCSKESFLINEYAFDEEALLLAGNNASGDYSVKHYAGKFNAYQRTYVINLASSECTYEYAKTGLEFMLAKLKRLSKGTNTKYLTMGMFNDMTILAPPKLLQEQYGEVIKNIEKLKAQEIVGLESLQKLTSSLQHQAFTTGFTS